MTRRRRVRERIALNKRRRAQPRPRVVYLRHGYDWFMDTFYVYGSGGTLVYRRHGVLVKVVATDGDDT